MGFVLAIAIIGISCFVTVVCKLIYKIVIIIKNNKLSKKYNSEYINKRVISLIKRAYGEEFYDFFINFDSVGKYIDIIKLYKLAIKFHEVKNEGAEKYLIEHFKYTNNIALDCAILRTKLEHGYYIPFFEMKTKTMGNLLLIKEVEGAEYER